MARLIYAMPASLDGYIAGPDGGPTLPEPGLGLHWRFNQSLKHASALLYGRRMYETMRVWEDDTPGRPEVEADFARIWRGTPKIVFSTTLREVGPNTRLVREDAEAFVRRLRAESAGDVYVSGAIFAAFLSDCGLIDEYQLYLLPVVLGGGRPYFARHVDVTLRWLGTERFPGDVVLLRYGRPA